MRTDYDALIIGGGPAGTTLASLLARAGWSVALIEKVAFPRRKVCGEVISATNFPLFDVLEVTDVLRSHAGPPLQHVALYSGKDQLLADLPQARDTPMGYGFTVAREYLDTVLLERARSLGVHVWQPWKAIRLTQQPEGYRCLLQSKAIRREDPQKVLGSTEQEISAGIVIAAHGSWDTGALPTQTYDTRPRDSDLFAFKAHFNGAKLSPTVLPVVSFPGGYGGMVTIDSGRTTFACCIRRDTLHSVRLRWPGVKAANAVMNHVQEQTLGVHSALHAAGLQNQWLSVGPLRPGIRAPCINNILVVGNARCETHPLIGEGITMAMQSAWLLYRRLTEAGQIANVRLDIPKIAQRYSLDWYQAFAVRVHMAALFAKAAMHPAVTQGVLPVFRRYPQLMTLGARWSGKVKPVIATNYRNAV